MVNKTIKVSERNYNKIMDIKDLTGLKSADNVLDKVLPDGVSTNESFEIERPAFNVGNISVSWNELRKSKIGDEWKDNNEVATILFNDEYGVLVRFKLGCDFFINYFHFL